MLAGNPAAICSMGWAAHGSLIAIAWQARLEILVTIHAGSDGCLHRTVRLEPRNPARQMPWTERDLFHTFAACSDQPIVAVAWENAGFHYVAIINLVTRP